MQQRSNRQRWWQKSCSDRPATVTSAESKIYFNSLENTKWQSTAPGPPLPLLPEAEEIEKRDFFNELKVKKPKVLNINTGTVRSYARENRLFSKWLNCCIYAEFMERILRGFIVLLCVISIAATVTEEPPRQVAKMWPLINSDVFMAFSHCLLHGAEGRSVGGALMCWNVLLEQLYHCLAICGCWDIRLITDRDQAEEAPDINTSIQPVHANGRQQSSLLMNAMVVRDNKGPTHTALHAECSFLSVICFCSSFTPHTDLCSGPADILKYMNRWWRSDPPDTMPWTHSSLAAKPQTTACHTVLSVNTADVFWNRFFGSFESNMWMNRPIVNFAGWVKKAHVSALKVIVSACK